MKEIAHSGRAHAKLSASGSSRWINCTGSVALEEFVGEEDQSSVFADEGTAAHELSELRLREQLGRISKKDLAAGLKKLAEGPHYSPSMEDYVSDYVTKVMERYHAAVAANQGAVILLEQTLDFSEWVPDGFGTGDVLIIAGGMLEIIDLKYGKGIAVSAVNNSQLKLYALGALNDYGFMYDVEVVRMTIIQPRLDSVSDDEMTVEDLLKWADETVRPKAAEALSEKGTFAAGNHCQFCKAKGHCRTRAFHNLELEQYDKRAADLLNPQEIGEILGRVDGLVKWAGEIKEYALKQALNGEQRFPGWKVVAGTSRRTITDPEAARDRLLDKGGYKWDDIHKPQELLGIGDLEKLVGKKNFPIVLDGLIDKPPGKPTLAPESDNRPEMKSGSVFEVIEDD